MPAVKGAADRRAQPKSAALASGGTGGQDGVEDGIAERERPFTLAEAVPD